MSFRKISSMVYRSVEGTECIKCDAYKNNRVCHRLSKSTGNECNGVVWEHLDKQVRKDSKLFVSIPVNDLFIDKSTGKQYGLKDVHGRVSADGKQTGTFVFKRLYFWNFWF